MGFRPRQLMGLRPRQRLQYHVERMLVRGFHWRLLFIAGLVALVSVGAGALVMEVDDGFGDFGEASWWAFLRLTDPGYLGDDEGVGKRVIATAVTVTGYVLFMGTLVAIMTQWLTSTMRNLERGFTPVARRGHILVLGWTNRTPSILQELMQSRGRARRFLRALNMRRLVIVVLAEDVSAELVQTLRESLGRLWDPQGVILRSGTALHVDHLERVSFSQAAAVIVPGADFVYGEPEQSDARIIKTILTIAHYGRDPKRGDVGERPLLVCELFDDRKLHVARRAYPGDIEILTSHRFIARLMTQIVRHEHVSAVFEELLAHGDGNEVYIRPCREFAGRTFAELVQAYPRAILIGFVEPAGGSFRPLLNPSAETVVHEETRAVLISRAFEDTEAGEATAALPRAGEAVAVDGHGGRPRRVLILGWNHKAPVLLQELSDTPSERFDVHVLSLTPVEERVLDVETHGLPPGRLTLTQHHGDYTLQTQLGALDPAGFDNVILLASDRLGSGEESDARTTTGHLVLTDLLADTPSPPRVLVEVLEPENAHLLGEETEQVVTPLVLSHMLAQVALRRELRAVFDELFGPGGAEIVVHSAADLTEGVGGETTFEQLQRRALERGEVAVGVTTADGGVHVNPPKDRSWSATSLRGVVVLVTS
jgi:hypothetical protein